MRTATLAAVLILLVAVAVSAQEAVEVTFVVNDALVKDKLLPGVEVLIAETPGGKPVVSGVTGDDGRFTTSLAPGTYAVSYLCPGFVPIPDSETTVTADGQVITTTMSLMLEAEGTPAARRIRIILNWGSDPLDVRDADSHVLCLCGVWPSHVYYADRVHQADTHSVDLDVDDMDWGGPETITLHEPPSGTYTYWVHDYSNDGPVLGQSEVVVRVLFDDALAGEFRIPTDVSGREWRPFKAIVVEPDLRPRIEVFTADELAVRADRSEPAEVPADSDTLVGLACIGSFMALFLLAVVVAFIRRMKR
jgi:hypothetical protein